MDFLFYFINNVLSQPVFIIGLVVIIGQAVQKTPWSKILGSTIKAMIGFTMINLSGQFLGTELLPLQPMFGKIFNMPVATVDIGASQEASLEGIGAEMALIFALGFVFNILLARFTKFKYVHLSPHVSFFFAGLIAALLKYNTNLSFIAIVIIGGILLGLYMTFTCAYIYPFMKYVKGGEGFTLAHSSSIGILFAGLLGKALGNKEDDLEEIKIPKSLGFMREMTVSLTVIMTLLFLILAILAGPSFVMENISGGQDIFVFSILKGVTFGMWITVIITGVRMLLAEVIESFHGIANKIIPNAIPGLDVPLLFPNYSNSVILGFLMSLVTGLLGMWILGVINYPVTVFPALIPTFYTGAVTAIFGNATGGKRGAIIGSGLNGFILIFGQALLLPMIGSYEPIMRILSETDYTFYGPLLGYLLRLITGGA